MATVTKEKKAEVKNYPPVKFKIEKKVFANLVKNQYAQCADEKNHILNAINLEINEGCLVMASTDGNRLLVTEHNLHIEEDFSPISINGKRLAQIKFLKGDIPKEFPDQIEIELSENGMKIFDPYNRITYEIPRIEGEYPNYKKLMIKRDNYKKYAVNIGYLNSAFMATAFNERTGVVTFEVDPENSLSNIFINGDDNQFTKTTILLCPVQIRE